MAMPRGTLLTLEERAKSDALSAEGPTSANIARRLSRTVNFVKRYLGNPGEYAKRLFTTRNTDISERERRNMLCEASKECSSASQLSSTLIFPICKRRVQHSLSPRLS